MTISVIKVGHLSFEANKLFNTVEYFSSLSLNFSALIVYFIGCLRLLVGCCVNTS